MLDTQLREEDIDTKKYYAAQVFAFPNLSQRSGPRVGVFFSWEECRNTIIAFPYTKIFEFSTIWEAERWIAEWDGGSSSSQPFEGDISYRSDEMIVEEQTLDDTHDEEVTRDEDDIRIEIGLPRARETWGEEDRLPQNPPDLQLSVQQKEVLERVKRGESVFFTGAAGTGKSVLLRAIITYMRSGNINELGITASTGIAAVNIGGQTLHSFAGIKLGKGKVENLVETVRGSAYAISRWVNVKTLIIDEISMIDGVLFDKVEHIARTIRGNNKPFGGIQLIVSGDFCQLPPVPDKYDGIPVPITFAFEAESWDRCVGTPVVLDQVFRQRDNIFVKMLNSMRYGTISEEDEARFQALSREVVYPDGIEPTELYPLRVEVFHANKARLKILPNPTHTYIASDRQGVDSRGQLVSHKYMESVLNKLVAVRELTLKIGAQVMLVMNMSEAGLVNGSLGRIVEFKTPHEAHRDQIQFAVPDDGDNSTPNQVKGIALEKLSTNPRSWPLVQFTNGMKLLCIPMKFEAVSVLGNVEASREQVPLILAWAMSIHKSQGQTIERVKVDLGRTFEKGQAYVALSRATNLEGLQVLNFERSKIMAHPRVLEWNERILKYYEEKKNRSFIEEVDNEEAIKAYFDIQDLESF